MQSNPNPTPTPFRLEILFLRLQIALRRLNEKRNENAMWVRYAWYAWAERTHS